jgi:hypothetical protein
MATVINDLTIEPKAAPPKDADAAPKEGGGAKSGPELERELTKVHRRQHDRALRMWTY